MSQNIILNRSHIINKSNNRLRYQFPNKVTFTEGDTLAVSHMNVYYSWFNVSKKYNNSFYQYKWWNNAGDLTETVDVVIPDGFYSIATLNEYLQSVMVKNKHFLKTPTSKGGDYVYFIEILQNITYYAVELRMSSLCESYVNLYELEYPDNAGWIAPPNTIVGGETVTHYETPQLIIPSNNNFGKLIGFNAQTIFQDTDVQGQYSFLNNFAGSMSPSSSFIMTCSLIDNELGIPSDILYSFTIPNNVSLGDLITSNTDLIYSKIKPGSYGELRITIVDQDFNELEIIDPDMLIVLSIIKQKVDVSDQ
jgi:hypothetical protein